MIRNVNRDGLGDRRGPAIEKATLRRYRPGTLDPLEARPIWIVYLDGRQVAVHDSEDAARADAIERWGNRA